MKFLTVVLVFTGLLCVNADNHVLDALVKVATTISPEFCSGVNPELAVATLANLSALVQESGVQAALGSDIQKVADLMIDAGITLEMIAVIKDGMEKSEDLETIIENLVNEGLVNETETDALLGRFETAPVAFENMTMEDVLLTIIGKGAMKDFKEEVKEGLECIADHIQNLPIGKFMEIRQDVIVVMCAIVDKLGNMKEALDELKEALKEELEDRIEELLSPPEPENSKRQLLARKRTASKISKELKLERRLNELMELFNVKRSRLHIRVPPGNPGGNSGENSGENQECPTLDEIMAALEPTSIEVTVRELETSFEILRFVGKEAEEGSPLLEKALRGFVKALKNLIKEVVSASQPEKRNFMIL